MIPLTETVILKVIRTTNPLLIELNKEGFNNEPEVGIYQMLYIETYSKDVIVTKPVQGFIDQIYIPYSVYEKDCEDLLTFRLFNN